MFFRVEFLLWRRVGDEAKGNVKNEKSKVKSDFYSYPE
jgi:hypothetical protein